MGFPKMLPNVSIARRASRKFALPAAAAAVLAPSFALAQNTVTGRIVDANGAALPGAEIVVRETGQRVITDRQGRCWVPTRQTLEDFAACEHQKKIQKSAGDCGSSKLHLSTAIDKSTQLPVP